MTCVIVKADVKAYVDHIHTRQLFGSVIYEVHATDIPNGSAVKRLVGIIRIAYQLEAAVLFQFLGNCFIKVKLQNSIGQAERIHYAVTFGTSVVDRGACKVSDRFVRVLISVFGLTAIIAEALEFTYRASLLPLAELMILKHRDLEIIKMGIIVYLIAESHR